MVSCTSWPRYYLEKPYCAMVSISFWKFLLLLCFNKSLLNSPTNRTCFLEWRPLLPFTWFKRLKKLSTALEEDLYTLIFFQDFVRCLEPLPWWSSWRSSWDRKNWDNQRFSKSCSKAVRGVQLFRWSGLLGFGEVLQGISILWSLVLLRWV